MNKLLVCLLIVLLRSPFLLAQQGEELDLDSCYRRIVQVHPLSGDLELIEALSGLQEEKLNSRFLPSLDFGAQASYQSDVTSLDLGSAIPGLEIPQPSKDQYKLSLDINQLIYDGGAVRKQIELERIRSASDKLQTGVSLYGLKQLLNRIYFSVLLLQEQEKVLCLADTLLAERIRLASSGMKNGVLSVSDLKNLRAERLNLRQEMEGLRCDLLAGRELLAECLDMDVSTIGPLLLPDQHMPEEEEISRPELDLLEMQKKSLEKTADLLMSERKPVFYAYGQAGYGKPGLNMLSDEFDSYYLVGARLSWKVFDWNVNRKERQRIRVQTERLGIQEESFREQTRTELIEERNLIRKYASFLDTDRELILLRQEITASSASAMEEGILTAVDYLQVWNAEKTARIQEKTHRVMLARSLADYRLKLGTPANQANK